MAIDAQSYPCKRCKEQFRNCMCDPQECRGEHCSTPIWWVSTPRGKSMPVEKSGEPHWGNCVDAGDFRG